MLDPISRAVIMLTPTAGGTGREVGRWCDPLDIAPYRPTGEVQLTLWPDTPTLAWVLVSTPHLAAITRDGVGYHAILEIAEIGADFVTLVGDLHERRVL